MANLSCSFLCRTGNDSCCVTGTCGMTPTLSHCRLCVTSVRSLVRVQYRPPHLQRQSLRAIRSITSLTPYKEPTNSSLATAAGRAFTISTATPCDCLGWLVLFSNGFVEPSCSGVARVLFRSWLRLYFLGHKGAAICRTNVAKCSWTATAWHIHHIHIWVRLPPFLEHSLTSHWTAAGACGAP